MERVLTRLDSHMPTGSADLWIGTQCKTAVPSAAVDGRTDGLGPPSSSSSQQRAKSSSIFSNLRSLALRAFKTALTVLVLVQLNKGIAKPSSLANFMRLHATSPVTTPARMPGKSQNDMTARS